MYAMFVGTRKRLRDVLINEKQWVAKGEFRY